MTDLQKIKTLLFKKQKSTRLFTADETLEVFEYLKLASENGKLIEKVIEAIKLVYDAEFLVYNLTLRETEILKLIGLGLNSKAISLALDISLDTVYTHRKKINKKLNINNKFQLYQMALKLT